jgi:hypothetical protein
MFTESFTESPPNNEIESLWLEKAALRAKELDDGTVQPISAKEVSRKAQALLR